MQRTCFIILFIVYSLNGSPTESRRRHSGNHRFKKTHESLSSQEDLKRTLPPNIWALLASNKKASDDETAGPKYNKNIEPAHDLNEIADDSLDFEPSKIDDDAESIKKVNCPKCKQNSVKMSENELANLRIEYVKNQILHKLRLTERPAPISKDELPEPIQEGYAINSIAETNTEFLNRHLDDYFAKTTQKIIFLTKESEKCKSHESKDYPSECFSFSIPNDVDVNSVESAQLWVYKEPNNLDYGMTQTFLLSEIGNWGFNLNFTKAKPIAISEFEHGEEWEKIDIAWPVKNWVEYHDLTHTIQLICETCSGGKLPISNHNDHKPFIVIDTFPQRTLSRQARNVNCGPDSSECCRDSLYIDFKTIGWDDWIIFPKGYNAFFCRGTCDKVASITAAGAHHSTILNKFMQHETNLNKKKLELVPCCTATRYSSLQILYIKGDKDATKVTLPNMIVESCGCS